MLSDDEVSEEAGSRKRKVEEVTGGEGGPSKKVKQDGAGDGEEAVLVLD